MVNRNTANFTAYIEIRPKEGAPSAQKKARFGREKAIFVVLPVALTSLKELLQRQNKAGFNHLPYQN